MGYITTVCPDLIVIITAPCQCQYCISDQIILLVPQMKFVITYGVIIVRGKFLGHSRLLYVATQAMIVLTVLIKL